MCVAGDDIVIESRPLHFKCSFGMQRIHHRPYAAEQKLTFSCAASCLCCMHWIPMGAALQALRDFGKGCYTVEHLVYGVVFT